jgi:hypothetical protein
MVSLIDDAAGYKMAAVAVVHIASLDQDLELAHRIKGKGSGDGGGCAQQVRLSLQYSPPLSTGDVAEVTAPR